MKSRVLIVGGGVAAIEAALALQDLAGEQTSVRIFSPRAEFVYRPYAVGEPYGAARVARYDMRELAPLCGADFQLDSVASVNSEARLITTYDGDTYPYDYLVLAQGAKLLWPGLAERAQKLETQQPPQAAPARATGWPSRCRERRAGRCRCTSSPCWPTRS